MAVVMVQFLMEKFIDALEEEGSAVQFHALFHEIKEELIRIKRSSSVPMGTATDLLRDSLYDLNDILIECQAFSKKDTDRIQCTHVRLSSLFTKFWFLYKTKKRLQMIKRHIQTISNGKVEQNSSSGSLSGDMGWSTATEFSRWTSRYVDKTKVYGINDQLNAIERMLFRADAGGFKGIGIVGMGGVGKTVLAQMIFNSQQVRRRFSPRLWVCMSQTVSKGRDGDAKREVLERMLMSLGVEEEVITSISEAKRGRTYILAELMFSLHVQLMGKRYLVVFDDVWDIDEWYEGLDLGLPREDEWGSRLGCVLPKGCGGSVIVTSRLEEAAMKMVGKENMYRIEPDKDEESCWNIFMDSVTKDGRVGDQALLRSMKTEIVDKCGGLPLAAKTIGEILCGSLPPADDSEQENKLDP